MPTWQELLASAPGDTIWASAFVASPARTPREQLDRAIVADLLAQIGGA